MSTSYLVLRGRRDEMVGQHHHRITDKSIYNICMYYNGAKVFVCMCVCLPRVLNAASPNLTCVLKWVSGMIIDYLLIFDLASKKIYIYEFFLWRISENH